MFMAWAVVNRNLLDLQVNVRELKTCSDPNQYATPSAKADFKVQAEMICPFYISCLHVSAESCIQLLSLQAFTLFTGPWQAVGQ